MIFDLRKLNAKHTNTNFPDTIIVNQRSTFEVGIRYNTNVYFYKYYNTNQVSDSFFISLGTNKEAKDFLELIDKAMTYNKLDHPQMFV